MLTRMTDSHDMAQKRITVPYIFEFYLSFLNSSQQDEEEHRVAHQLTVDKA